MERLNKLRNFLIENEFKGKQTFNSRSLLKDSIVTIYQKDGITVYYCYYYDYLEIFGLSNEEYNSLKDILDIE